MTSADSLVDKLIRRVTRPANKRTISLFLTLDSLVCLSVRLQEAVLDRLGLQQPAHRDVFAERRGAAHPGERERDRGRRLAQRPDARLRRAATLLDRRQVNARS